MRVARVQRRGMIADAVIVDRQALVIGDWTSANAEPAPGLAERSAPELLAGATARRETLPIEEVKFLPPIGRGAKILCLGVNYRDHATEVGRETPSEPSLFSKFPDALVGHGAAISRPRVSEQFDYEGEIAVVMGAPGRHISQRDALSYVFGYTVFLDGSVRDYQRHSLTAGKNFHRSGACGPWIVTADEIPDPKGLSLETRLNGETVQSTTADLMIYDVATAISYVSRWTPLAPGDIIAMGTPAGVGAGRSPPLWMRAGDRVEVAVSGVGVLENFVEDEAD